MKRKPLSLLLILMMVITMAFPLADINVFAGEGDDPYGTSFDTAVELTGAASGTFSNYDDYHYYVFNVPQTSKITVWLSTSDENGNKYAYLYDSNRNSLGNHAVKSPGGQGKDYFVLAGTYYLKISGQKNGGFSVSCSKSNQYETIAESQTNRYDTLEDAVPLSLDTSMQGVECINDFADSFYFDLPHDGTVTVATFTGQYDHFGQFYDSEGVAEGDKFKSKIGAADLYSLSMSRGRHYVIFTGSDQDGVYVFRINFTPDASQHEFTEWTVVTEPTCISNGSEERVCTICGYTETQKIPTPGHQYSDWAVTQPPTCTEAGREERTCSVCGRVAGRAIAATGHSWEDDFTVDIEPTCLEEGSKSIHCANCSEVKDVTPIPLGDHSYVFDHYATEPGCLEDGSEVLVCSVCGDEKTQTVPATGHQYGDWTITQDATCADAGSREKVCSACGDKVTEVIDPLGHDWENDYTIDIEPSCTGAGSKSIHCKRCEGVKEITEIDPVGHSWSDWETVTPSTCVDSGVQQRVCIVCGVTETADLDPKGHDFKEEFTVDKAATCTEDGSRSRHCKNCDAVTDSEVITSPGHQYGDWTIEDSTCTEPGHRSAECGVCGDVLTEEIQPKGHAWNDEPTVDKEPTCSEEGSQAIHCARCGAVKEGSEETVPKIAHTEEVIPAVPATCDEAGKTAGKKCSVCGEIIEAPEAVDALGHDWGDWTVVKEATEDEPGLKTRTCSREPSHIEEEVIPKLPHSHKMERTAAVPATCTEDGNIEFWTCSKCGKIYSDEAGSTEITEEETADKAKGHEWNDEPTVDKEPTCTEEGSQAIHCARCREVKDVTPIPSTGHSFGSWVTVTKPTETSEGREERVCGSCGSKEQREIPKTRPALCVKNLWASQHSVGKVLFKWTRKDGVTVTGWKLKYRTRKIGGNNAWSGWTEKSYSAGTFEAWINVPVDYVVEVHAQAKDDKTWSTGIITCPAGGKYQAMKNTYVLNVTSKPYNRLKGSTITLNKGQSIKVKPDYEYPIADYNKRPRLYPNQMLYDVADKTIIRITKPDGSIYTGGMIDGTATITGIKEGKTGIVFRAPNGRTQVFTIEVTK